jgi:hypothetical protein
LREHRLAWLTTVALTTVIISFFGVNFVVSSSLHMFNVDQAGSVAPPQLRQ